MRTQPKAVKGRNSKSVGASATKAVRPRRADSMEHNSEDEVEVENEECAPVFKEEEEIIEDEEEEDYM